MTAGLFDLGRLFRLLRSAEARVRIGTFGDLADRVVLLRHDVDISVRAAGDLGDALAAEGRRGTFFFRLRAPGYNIADPAVLRTISAIATAGHQVGLHWESPTGTADEELDVAVRRDRMLLEQLLPANVPCATIVSAHRPDPRILGVRLEPPLESTYAAPYFRAGGATYRSDSNGAFDWAAFEAQLSDPDWRILQLLIHAEWWTIPATGHRDVYRQLLEDTAVATSRWLRSEIESFGRLDRDDPTLRDR